MDKDIRVIGSPLRKRVVIGVHAISSLLTERAYLLQRVILKESLDRNKLRAIIGLCKKHDIPVEITTPGHFKRFDVYGVHQGVVGVIKGFDVKDEEDLIACVKQKNGMPKCIVALDQIQDPGNVGAIIRSAVAFGINNIIIPKRGQAYLGETMWKASSGTLVYINMVQVTNLGRTLVKLKEFGYWIVGLDSNSSSNIDNFSFPGLCVMVLGSEHKGLREGTRKKCDFTVKIKLDHMVESLNVSAAASIAFHVVANKLLTVN